MMKSLLLASTRTGAGKTTIGLGLAACQNQQIGYFKPLADRIASKKGVIYDLDAKLFHAVFSLKEDVRKLSIIHDYAALIEDRRDLKSLVVERFEQVAKDKELVIIEGPRNYSYGSYIGLSAGEIAFALSSPVVIIANGGLGVVVDKALAARYFMESIGAKVLGVIINGTPQEEVAEMEGIAKPALEGQGLEVFGIVPWEGRIAQITPRLIAEALSARVLAGQGGLDRDVDHTLVGAMTVEQALRRLRRYRNVALITGGDRTDMQLAAYEVSTRCLILTGGVYPDPIVLSKADELNIPVMLVPEDTYTTARRVEGVEPLLKPGEQDKIELVKGAVGSKVAINKLIALL